MPEISAGPICLKFSPCRNVGAFSLPASPSRSTLAHSWQRSGRPLEDAVSALAYAISLIKRWEGCKLEAYPDPGTGGDPWTVGYGATGPGIAKGVKWTQAQADERLAQDVTRFLKGVQSAVKKPATDAQIGAMTSLAYNIGAKAFANSTLLRKFNAGDIAGAAAEFTRWNRAGGRVMKGLTNRRLDEQRVFRE